MTQDSAGRRVPTEVRYPLVMTRLPPGPPSVLLTTLAYLRDPYQSILTAARRYGNPYTSPSFLGKMVVTGDPVGIRTLFTADPETYSALGAELLGPVLGESNLILLSGERHRAMRKLQTPPFHGARMRAYGRLILDIAEQHAGRWPRTQPFAIHESMQEISLEVILQAVLGLSQPSRRAAFKKAVLDGIAALKPSFMFIPALRRQLFGLSAWSRFQRATARLRALFDAELAERRAVSEPREDILSLLLSARYEDGSGLTDEELFEQMLNLIGAGHETTASTLAWAFYFIHQDPGVRDKLLEELRALPAAPDPDVVAHLPYLEAVCSEALRINPVAPMIGRTLRKSLVLHGYELPPGISVGAAVLVVHRRDDLYPQPERFVPERFLTRTYSPFEYLPFGGGSRRCLGAAFALYEMKLVLSAILGKHSLRLLDAGPIRSVVRNTTVGPGQEIRMALA
jgi:cytochrome P450